MSAFPRMYLGNYLKKWNPEKGAVLLQRPSCGWLKKKEIRDLLSNTRKRQKKFIGLTGNLRGPLMTASIKRQDVFLVNFDPTVGAEAKKTRPALVVSNNINNAHSPIVSISPITSNVTRVYSFEVEVLAGIGGLNTRSKVMVNQTRAVDKVRLIRRLGNLPDEIMEEINNALKLHYGLE
jgi:mRNA interferase MazF